MDRANLADMPHLTNPFHTGSVEVFHRLINMYAPKSVEFDMHVMDARIKLAVIDYNSNVNRKQATIKKKRQGGGNIGDKKMEISIYQKIKRVGAERG